MLCEEWISNRQERRLKIHPNSLKKGEWLEILVAKWEKLNGLETGFVDERDDSIINFIRDDEVG